jgi:SAM-dependent methyltransferase
MTVWPKTPPVLTPEQLKAREGFMKLWHEVLPKKYGLIEKFNQGYVAQLPLKEGSVTLEVGAGLGEHAKYEDLSKQDYYCLDYREEFCKELRKVFSPSERVSCGDIQKKQEWAAATFDRIIAIHVLEHLPDLPAALAEISRLLKPDGVFDVVIPTDGGFAYNLARRISAERFFKKNFKMDYGPIIKNEHVSTYDEITEVLFAKFRLQTRSFFPCLVPISGLNLCVGMRLGFAPFNRRDADKIKTRKGPI